MSKPPRVTSAFAVSVLVHVILFTVLALIPEPQPAMAEKQIDQPLEVTFQPLHIAAPSPTPALEREIVRRKIESELKRADRAPANTEHQATHDSMAANPRQGSAIAASASAPAPRFDTQGLSLVAMRESSTVPAAKGALTGTGNDDAPGIAAAGAYGLAVNNAIAISGSLQASELGSLAVGEVGVEFCIDAKGIASNIRIVSNNTGSRANERFAICAIRNAKFPPMPSNFLAGLHGNQKIFSYTFGRDPIP